MTNIFLDFDDTIYDTRGNATIALGEVFEEFGLGRYFDDAQTFIDIYWKKNNELWKQYSLGQIERQYLIIERFRYPLSFGLTPTAEYCQKVSDRFLELCSDKPGSISGAHELLKGLKAKGYRLHIASNGFHEIQYRKLRAAGMIEYFDTIILSEDAGVNKPSKAFYDYALRMAGTTADASLMIGDNYENDVLGAVRAGIPAILYRRWDPSFVPSDPAIRYADRLTDILQMV